MNLGLPTRYIDFYRHYLALDSTRDSNNLLRLKKHLQDCLYSENFFWSDLEEALGKYSTNLSSFNEMEEVYDHINDELQRYLYAIESSELPHDIDPETFKNHLCAPENFLNPAEQKSIRNYYDNLSRGEHSITIINFNYTSTIEKLLHFTNRQLELGKATYDNEYPTVLQDIIHVHGNIKQPIIGVNDASQILNEKLRNDVDVQEYLIKPRINSVLGSLADERAKRYIESANLICIFGLSLGATDCIWWEAIGKQLAYHNRKVIIFAYDPTVKNLAPRKTGRFKRLWKTKFCDAAKIPLRNREDAMEKLIIAPNTPMFNIIYKPF